MPINPIYRGLCPSCGGDADAYSIEYYGTCRRCSKSVNTLGLSLLQLNRSIDLEVEEFEDFFRRATGGFSLWGSQKVWVKRLLKGENTSIIAPTGIGKTTLLLTFALYMNTRYRKKVLILAPTSSLAKQINNKINIMATNIGYKGKIVFYDSTKNKKYREEVLNSISSDNYDILIITNAFLARRPQLFVGKFFDIVIADDVDSILNRSKNIIRLLNMLGYSDEAINLARQLTDLRSRLLVLKTNGLEEQYSKELKKYIELESKLRSLKTKHEHGQIIVASATGRARGPYISVMRELLEFDVSGITLYARDVTDSYLLIKPSNLVDEIIRVIKLLGKGGIILISSYHPFKQTITIKDLVNKVSKELGIRVARATPSAVKKLIEGDIDLIIGSASYYGVSVRGIDSPRRIKYVVFIGTPCFAVELENLLANIRTLYRVLIYLSERGFNVREYLIKLSKILRYMNRKDYRVLTALLKGRISTDDITSDKLLEKYHTVKEILDYTLEKIKEILDQETKTSIGTLILLKQGGKYTALIPDLMTYIQASGRTSRLLNGNMTHGISVVIEDLFLEELVKALDTRMNYINNSSSFKSFTKLDLRKELRLAETSRRNCKGSFDIRFRTLLLVVESPTKAKTIAGFFGKPARRRIGNIIVYETPLIKDNEIVYLNIVATRGHIYDITTDPSRGLYGLEYSLNNNLYQPVFDTIKRCRICGHQFTYGSQCPRCGSTAISDSREVINVLRKLASEVDEILIATDPDIEGEKIAYDVYLIVKPINSNVYRVEFHEVTKRELENALNNKRNINHNLVQAQLFRRILDRLIGFSLSTHLWSKYGKHWLGAGRVQTPVLGWIIDAYRDWRSKQCIALSIVTGPTEPYLTVRICLNNKEEAKELLDKIDCRKRVDIMIIKRYSREEKPVPPYTTDELLYEASLRGIPAPLTMKIAQELFEAGLITYHRTDSTYVSNVGIGIAKKYLETKGLLAHFTPRHWGSKGTHEAIRPTNPWDAKDLEKAITEGLINVPIYLTPLHIKIYDMIFRRFIASQMRTYVVENTAIKIILDTEHSVEIDVPSRIIKEGYNLVLKPRIYSWLVNYNQNNLPIVSIRKYRTSLGKLLDHGSVIRAMKREGIGRPSTYASTIARIRRHGYVIESKRRKYLIPTKIGIEVYNYLSKTFPDLVSVDTTRYMEELIDLITQGKIDSGKALDSTVRKLTGYKLVEELTEYTAIEI